jgi:hypothetical protein
LNFNLSGDKIGGTLMIFNSLGKKVYDLKIQSTRLQIDLSKLADGFYILNYSKESFSYSSKFVKAGVR